LDTEKFLVIKKAELYSKSEIDAWTSAIMNDDTQAPVIYIKT
jgi:hypothetical protein